MSSIEHFPTPEFVPGQHVLIDFYGASGLTEVDVIKQGLREAAAVCGASVLNINLHSFGKGQGVTGVALLAESHISIHTWPEYQYVALDVFMCGDCEPCKAIPVLEQLFLPSEKQINVVERGNRLPSLNRFEAQIDFLPPTPELPVRLQKSERE